MRRARTLCIVIVAVVAACSGSESSTRCANLADASVCATHDQGVVTFTAEGLQPGSTLTVTDSLTGSTKIPVAATGGLDGEAGIMSATGDFPDGIFMSIEAVTEDGSTLTAELAFE